ncbi:MAG: SusC/RagA family TonB-linked outer membrane protein [Saprospiraceae bacterium]|nr:SusC/RagA family TonB-linked outer membrane protein [Saprospiraceae bacterium]
MKKHLFLFGVLLYGYSLGVNAQASVRGTVTRSDGEPIIGANVIELGSNNGTVTDLDGNYQLKVGPNAILEFTYTGYVSQKFTVGNQTIINVTLAEGVALSEIIVTALGISRERKSLSYAAQTIQGGQLTQVRDANFVNTLQGKVAGLVVTSASSGVGGATRVNLRGNRSIQSSNNALFVVDGVPVDNSTPGQVGNDFGGYNGSDGVANINPDDIESINVLKGAAASVLYGSRAANGVILITTKKGSAGAISVDVNSGAQFDAPLTLPHLQNEYGQGNGGVFGARASASWGPKMNNQAVIDWTGKAQGMVPQPNNISDFFQIGSSFNNSVGIKGGTDKVQSYFSFTNNQAAGVVPGNTLDRNTINLRISTNLSKKFSTDAKVTYVNQILNNKLRSGEESSEVMNLYKTPRSIRIEDMQNYESEAGVPTYWTSSSIYMNPYWTINRTSADEERTRTTGLVSATYQINDDIKVLARVSLDQYTDKGENTFFNNTLLFAWLGGTYQKSFRQVQERNSELLLIGNKKLNNKVKLSYTFGVADVARKSDFTQTSANGLLVPNKFDLGFARNLAVGTGFIERDLQSVFGSVQVSLNDYLYFDVTARNDWSSTLPAPHSYFYPSLGLTAVLSDMVELPSFISFAKLRGSYTLVGNDAAPYLLTQTYSFSQGGVGGFINRDATQAFGELKPELTTSLEFGFDGRFFDNRIGLDVTFYKTNSINQLLSLPLAPASGFSNQYINAGDIENSGVELTLTGSPIKKNDLTWDVMLNYARNVNAIVALHPDIKQTFISSGFVRTAGVLVKEGGAYGDLYADGWARTPSGQLIMDGAGKPLVSSTQEYLGNFNPKFTLGLNNAFSFGKIRLNVLVDARIGGVMTSGSDASLAFDGSSAITTAYREGGWVLPGVTLSNNEYIPNTYPINAETFWTTVSKGRYSWGQVFTYDATNVRIREAVVGYDITINSQYVKKATLSIVARNLFFLAKGNAIIDIPGIPTRKMWFDPDVNLGAGNYQGVEFGTLPSSRSIGLNLSLSF